MWFSVQRILAMQAATAAFIALGVVAYGILMSLDDMTAVNFGILLAWILAARVWFAKSLIHLSRTSPHKEVGGWWIGLYIPLLVELLVGLFSVAVLGSIDVAWSQLWLLPVGLVLFWCVRHREWRMRGWALGVSFVAITWGSLVLPLALWRAVLEEAARLGHQLSPGGRVLLMLSLLLVIATLFCIWDTTRRRLTWLRIKGLDRLAGADDEYRGTLKEGR